MASAAAGIPVHRPGSARAAGLVLAVSGLAAAHSPPPVLGQQVERTLTLGTAIGPQEASFVRIADVEVAGDGRIVVLDEGTGWISVFDRDGHFLQRFGGKGEGPGEFGYIGAAALTGDTLIVLDRNGGKLVYFLLDGTLLDTHRSGFSVHFHGFPIRLYPLPGGGLVLEGRSGCSLPRREGEDTQWRLVSIAPGEPAVLRRQDAGNILAVYGTEGGVFCTTLDMPFGALPLVAVRADGVFAFATGGAPRVALYGDPARRPTAGPTAAWFRDPPAGGLRLPASAREFTRQDREAWQDAAVASRTDPDAQRRERRARQLRDAMDEIEYPERWPAYDRLLFDADGDLWARRSPSIDAADAEWDIVRTDGTQRGTVRLPATLDVRVVSGGSVYGIETGDWDEDLVLRFDVQWD